MIGAACESAEKVLADTRKAYCFGNRQGLPIVPTLDKAQASKIQEQENVLRAAVNFGTGIIVDCHFTFHYFYYRNCFFFYPYLLSL